MVATSVFVNSSVFRNCSSNSDGGGCGPTASFTAQRRCRASSQAQDSEFLTPPFRRVRRHSVYARVFFSVSGTSFTDVSSTRNGGCVAIGNAGNYNGVMSQGQGFALVTNTVFTNCRAQNAMAWMANRNFCASPRGLDAACDAHPHPHPRPRLAHRITAAFLRRPDLADSYLILGGAIACSNDINVTSSTFRGCSASSAGGSLFSMRSLIISDCVFENSTSGSFGGAGAIGNFKATPGVLSVARTRVVDTHADIDGGAFFSENDIDVAYSTFTRVSAGRNGGAVFGYRQVKEAAEMPTPPSARFFTCRLRLTPRTRRRASALPAAASSPS